MYDHILFRALPKEMLHHSHILQHPEYQDIPLICL